MAKFSISLSWSLKKEREKRRSTKRKECKTSNGDHAVHTVNVSSVYQVTQMYKLLHT